MKTIKISAIIESYEGLNLWIRGANYIEWITSEGMYFEIENNDVVGEADVVMVEHYNIRYIPNNEALYLFDEYYCYVNDNDYIKQLIDLDYHLNN